ncbi:MAG: glycoside hydrolase family 9 protein [Bacteroidota bacterium]
MTTGGYGDKNFGDEWYWAAAELFVTTKDKNYYAVLEDHSKTFFHYPHGQVWECWLLYISTQTEILTGILFSTYSAGKRIYSKVR